MLNTQIIEFISASRNKGASFEDIQRSLIAGGWSEAQAQQAVFEAKQQLSPAPSSNPFAAQSAQAVVQPTRRVPSLSSPFGSLLKVVLLLCLVVLIGNAMYDLQNIFAPLNDMGTYGTTDPNMSGRLLVAAGVSLVVWLITAVLYNLLKQEHAKYRTLLDPYYMVSGWLTLTLFLEVGKYVLDKNTTLGVYVSLALLIIVFTSAILGFQRYSHRSSQS